MPGSWMWCSAVMSATTLGFLGNISSDSCEGTHASGGVTTDQSDASGGRGYPAAAIGVGGTPADARSPRETEKYDRLERIISEQSKAVRGDHVSARPRQAAATGRRRYHQDAARPARLSSRTPGQNFPSPPEPPQTARKQRLPAMERDLAVRRVSLARSRPSWWGLQWKQRA